jgi:hypothetical protein
LADRCCPAELAPVTVTLCGRKTCTPRESDAFRLTGHITGAGTLHGHSPGRQWALPLEGSLAGVDVQRRYLWKSFRDQAWNRVRDQPGTLFGFTPESRSPSPGIRTLYINHKCGIFSVAASYPTDLQSGSLGVSHQTCNFPLNSI